MLQWRFWMGNGGIRELNQTREEVVKLNSTLADQRDINTALRAEVTDLVDGVSEIEERARSELGMVGADETFYQFVGCLLYTSDAADDTPCVDLGGRRIIK